MTVYRFQREPSPKRFVAESADGTITERLVLEGESLTDALSDLYKGTETGEVELLECAFRAGYLVGAWDAKNDRMWPTTA